LGILNSEFAKSVVGSLAGAFAGAYAAQRIIERSKQKEELIKEIRNANAAATMSFMIANTFLTIKKQHVKQLYESFERDRAAVLEFKKRKRKPGEQFEFRTDFEFLAPVTVSIVPLQTLVFERISAPGRPLGLASILRQTIDSVNGSLELRNNLIQAFNEKNLPHDQLAPAYFGLPTERGVDQVYASTLRAINTYTDDCIHFSKLLTEDLIAYANTVKARFEKNYRESAPGVVAIGFTKPEYEELLPNPEPYRDWESMFITRPPEQKKSRSIFKFTDLGSTRKK
jgi:hypothetical protein